MFNRSKFLLLVLLGSMVLKVHSTEKNNNETLNNKCVNHGQVCDLKNKVTCCDKNLICQLAVANDLFICARESALGNSCLFDEDCASIWHGECSIDHICVCQPNHVPKNDKYCAPLVDEYCLQNYQCGTENSVCLNNKCQCKDGYFLDSKHKCLPIIIGKKCETDQDCDGLKFAKCSRNKICVCESNTVALTPVHCYPLLDSFCQVDKDCKVEFSICMKNKCVCQPRYAVYFDKCFPMYLGMRCRTDIDCRISLNNTMCYYNKCKCFESYFETKDGICKPESQRSCLDDELCSDKNSFCLNRKCHCKANYTIQGSKCVPLTLYGSCNTDTDCRKIRFAVCSENRTCTCKDGFFGINRSTCISKLGAICRTNEQCYVGNSICVDNVCQCKFEYLNVADKQCVLIESGEFSCHNNDPNCRLFTSVNCLSGDECVCTEYKVRRNTKACSASSGEFCTNNYSCGSEHSVCIANRCECKSEYVSHSKTDCPAFYLGMPCSHDSYCKKFIEKTVCRKNICVCDDQYSAKGNLKCLPKLNTACSDDEPCGTIKSICFHGKCQCEAHYIQQGSECVLPNAQLEYSKICSFEEDCNGANLNDSLSAKFCNVDQDCWSFRNTRCSPDHVCVCKENHFAFNNNSCHPISNGFCRADKDCGLNFHCVNSKCQCKYRFSSMSVNQCISTHYLYSCNDDTDCSDPWHSKCSEDKKCVCNVNNISTSKSTCLPILNGYCWRNDQCVARNSICDDFRCTCKSNYVAIAHNLCVRK